MRAKSLAQEHNTVPWCFGIYDAVHVYWRKKRKKAGRKTQTPFQRRGEEGHAGDWSSNRFVGDSCQ